MSTCVKIKRCDIVDSTAAFYFDGGDGTWRPLYPLDALEQEIKDNPKYCKKCQYFGLCEFRKPATRKIGIQIKTCDVVLTDNPDVVLSSQNNRNLSCCAVCEALGFPDVIK